VTADRNQMEQVLLNLAVNARDAMPQGGLLSFRARQVELDHAFCHTHPWAEPGVWLELEVADTGEGMTPEVRERIFEPFFTTKEPGVGTGLGLAVAYSLITSHGGGILVHSRPGQGTRFRIYLPVSQHSPMPAATPRPHQAPPRGKGQSVLVVDDEAAVREICRQALSMHGYNVSEAAEGRMALELYRWAMQQGRPYDLVILDLAMPVMDGRQCLQELLKLDPNLRVIIATGHGYDDRKMDDLIRRAAGVLSKPFDLQSLLTEVARVLRR
jgi:CheY-like chemotaxis protein